MIIVDASVWIDLFHGTQTPQTDWIKEVLKHQSISLTDLILCEVLQGIRDDRLYPEIRKVFLGYEILPMGGTALALASAENYRKLQTKGITIRKTIDCLIASFCILNGCSLLHGDRDFNAFEENLGLQVIHP
jgi:predicted nucleic acid-binding protein